MKALLLLALSVPLWADTYFASFGQGVFSTFEQASGLGATATAQADIDIWSGMPIAIVNLSSWCNPYGQCTYASGSASFSVGMDIVSNSGASGLIEIGAAQDATEIWGRTSFGVSLPSVGFGPHGLTEYEFSSGEQFTIAGSVSGGCSECSGAGWVRVLPYYITEVPEPASFGLVFVGLGILISCKRCGS